MNELLLHVWMNLKNIMLRRKSQIQKSILIYSYIILKPTKLIHSDKKQITGCLKWVAVRNKEGLGLIVKRQEENLGAFYVFSILTVVLVTWVYIFIKTLQTIYLKWVCFIVCKLSNNLSINMLFKSKSDLLFTFVLKVLVHAIIWEPDIKCKKGRKDEIGYKITIFKNTYISLMATQKPVDLCDLKYWFKI